MFLGGNSLNTWHLFSCFPECIVDNLEMLLVVVTIIFTAGTVVERRCDFSLTEFLCQNDIMIGENYFNKAFHIII